MVARGAVCFLVLAVAIAPASCGGAPSAAAPAKPAEKVDFSPAAWEAAARKVEWDHAERAIRCAGTDTSVTVPEAWLSHVEIRAEGDVRIRAGRDEDGVLLVRAKAGEVTFEDFARDFVDGLETLGARPPNEATLSFENAKNGQMVGRLTTAPATLAAEDNAFRYRYSVVQRTVGSCRIFALVAEASADPQGESSPMLRLVESVPGSSLDEIVGTTTLRTFGQILGVLPRRSEGAP